MRIHYFIAGAANMYCGSCLRDNALAAELIAQGHQVLLLPLYTPIRTDEPDVSQHHIFFGGLSVYLEQRVPWLRRGPRFLDKLWDSFPLLQILSRLSIRTDPHSLGALTVSILRGEEGNQRREFEKLLEWLVTQPRPDVVVLPFSLLIGLAAPLKRALGCAVCCSLQGEDLYLDGLDEPYRSQSLELIRRQIPSVDAFLPVCDYYATFMRGYLGLPGEKIHVTPLGINLRGYPESPRPPGGPFRLGYLARVTPEKNLHTLAAAYAHLRNENRLPPSRLQVAGYLAPDCRSYLREVQLQMRGAGLESEFEYRGELTRAEKIAFLRELHVFSVPGSYPDPKGLSVLEAMACGVPVVQPRHGAHPEMLARTGGGLLFEPGNVTALAGAIESLWKDAQLATSLGRAGFEGTRRHYSISDVAARAAEVYARVASAASAALSAPVRSADRMS